MKGVQWQQVALWLMSLLDRLCGTQRHAAGRCASREQIDETDIDLSSGGLSET